MVKQTQRQNAQYRLSCLFLHSLISITIPVYIYKFQYPNIYNFTLQAYIILHWKQKYKHLHSLSTSLQYQIAFFTIQKEFILTQPFTCTNILKLNV